MSEIQCTAPQITSQWLQWLRRLTAYSGIQVLVLLVNGGTGFFLVRGMTKEHYAWFTITNSLLATISVLSDSGLSSAMMSIGGRICDDRPRFAQFMRFARVLQFRFLAAAVLFTLPAGLWLLSRNGAPWHVILVLLVLIIAISIDSLDGVTLGTHNKLHRRVSYILEADLYYCFTRLLAVVLGMLSGLTAIWAALATSFAQRIQVLRLRAQSKEELNTADSNPENWGPEVYRFVRHLFPLFLFNCVQAHVATWLLSVFAQAQSVADVGALARLSIIFSFLGLPMTQLVTPVIARTHEPRRLRWLCIGTLTGMSCIATLFVGLGMWFSPQVLWILGDSYGHLTHELGWFLGAQALSVVTNVAWGVACVRGWVGYNWVQVPLTVLAQLLAIRWLDVSHITHSIAFAAIANVIGLVVTIALIVRGLVSHSSGRSGKHLSTLL